MEEIKRNKGIIIVLTIFFGIIIGIAIYINYNKNKSIDNYSNLEPVKEHIAFFTVSNNITNYLNNINEKKYNVLLEILDERYIKKNNINKNNIDKKLENYEGLLDISVKEMSYVDIDGTCIYFVKGDLVDNNTMDETTIIENDYYVIVVMDYDNYTVAIYPTTEDECEEDINSINNGTIKKGNYNEYETGGLVSNDYMCNLYLNDLLVNSITDGDRIYNNLDENVKQYITSSEELNNFLDEHEESISASVNSCDVEKDGDNNIYYIYDENGNYYEFTEYSVLNYKVYFEIE